MDGCCHSNELKQSSIHLKVCENKFLTIKSQTFVRDLKRSGGAPSYSHNNKRYTINKSESNGQKTFQFRKSNIKKRKQSSNGATKEKIPRGRQLAKQISPFLFNISKHGDSETLRIYSALFSTPFEVISGH